MAQRDREVPRHESVEHDDPTDAGLMDDEEVPGTGIMGDETVVRPASDEQRPGIAPGTVKEAEADAHGGSSG